MFPLYITYDLQYIQLYSSENGSPSSTSEYIGEFKHDYKFTVSRTMAFICQKLVLLIHFYSLCSPVAYLKGGHKINSLNLDYPRLQMKNSQLKINVLEVIYKYVSMGFFKFLLRIHK